MTTTQVIELIDDIDGTKATETVSFGLDGTLYEIDLSGKNAVNLRGLIDSYAKYSRKVKNTGKAKRNRTGETADIRRWAISQGFKINRTGRIPANLESLYAMRISRAASTARRAPESDREPGPGREPTEPATEPGEPATAPAPAPVRRAAPLQFREPASPAGGSTADVRAWARSNGIPVTVRGRIPAEIQAKYDAAHGRN